MLYRIKTETSNREVRYRAGQIFQPLQKRLQGKGEPEYRPLLKHLQSICKKYINNNIICIIINFYYK